MEKVGGRVRENVRAFILGGNSEFTLTQEPDIQFKYKVKKAKDAKDLYFVCLEEKKKFVYQGVIVKNDGKYVFRVGAKGNKDYNSYALQGLLWVLNKNGAIPEQVGIYHHGVCSVCGRKLSDPYSINCGVGPTCREKIKYFG